MAVKLVIVDDEEFIRLPMKDYFEDSGWAVVTFNSGEEALSYFEAESADCVLADMRLPGMTGIEFVINANRCKPGMRFVIYSGAMDFSIIEELKTAGVQNYSVVNKPVFDLNELRKALEGDMKGAC